MYLHLGQNMVVPKADIIGIFDIENCSGSRHTRRFLKLCEDAGEVVDLSTDLPRVFAVCEHGGEETVYLSQLSSQTLLSRWEKNEIV